MYLRIFGGCGRLVRFSHSARVLDLQAKSQPYLESCSKQWIKRMLIWIDLILLLNLLGLGGSTQPTSAELVSSPPRWWAKIRADRVDLAFWIGLEPRYGAFFSGSNCHNQHYLGPGGDQATCQNGCIWNWNWWGNQRNVLLCPKCWLYSILRILGPIPERWQGSNYQATCWFN